MSATETQHCACLVHRNKTETSHQYKYQCNSVFYCVHSDFLLLPWGSGQGDEQSLQNASDVNNGALLSDEKVHGWEDEEAVQHQAHYHGYGVKPQFLSHSWRVIHLQDLTGNQKHNPKGEVPAKGARKYVHEMPVMIMLLCFQLWHI